MSKPPIGFQLLREIAECASGMRSHDLYFVVDAADPNRFDVKVDPPQPVPEKPHTVVIHVSRSDDPDTRVTTAIIGDGADLINLLDLTVGTDDPHQGGTFPADAVFWSVSAVEKFLVPYYASVYGDQAGTYVASLLAVLLPPPDVTDALEDTAFAIAHLPSSEYTKLMLEEQPGQTFVPHAVALRSGGRVHPVVAKAGSPAAHSTPRPRTNGSRSRYERMAGR
ncbi:MAG TPA: hypothetical protein VGB15_11625 [Longimicrobium sp.]|jgi:hypothetical protein